MKALRWLENGVLKLIFATTVHRKGAILTSEAGYDKTTESVV